MKTKPEKNNKMFKTFIIEFGTEKFRASQSKIYPRIGQWTLLKYKPPLFKQIPIGSWYTIATDKKFKELADIKKFIRNREYM
jgi:hypothetical protein